MKKINRGLFFFWIGFFSFNIIILSAESRPRSESQSASSPLFFKEISKKLSESFCQKMDECAKEKIPLSKCESQMDDMFTQSNNQLPKKIELKKEELELCVNQIKTSSCNDLQAAQKIKGCEFIEKLSSER